MHESELRARAAEFADDLTTLLNGTICHGISISSTLIWERVDDAKRLRVAKVTNGGIDPQPITVTLGRKKPTAYLGLACSLRPDDEGQHLMVVSSFISLCLDQELDEMLCHFDYERDKSGYPEAHIQICGRSAVWDAWRQRRRLSDRPLPKAHFPVGGRRNRTSLEDIIEFMIAEGLVDSHRRAEELIHVRRDAFHARQLKAAVRRNPAAALEELRANGLV